jgi:hypothetical protein
MKTRFLQIVVVSDYHDLDLICDAFVGLKLSNREIGTTITNRLKYVGVIFDGCSPGDGELFDAISESGVIMERKDEPKKLKKPKCTKRKT